MFTARKQIQKFLLAIILILCNYPLVFSQVSDTIQSEIPTRKTLNVTNIQDLTKDGFNFWQDKFSGHFAGIDFGINALLNNDYSGYTPEEAGFMDNDLMRSNSLFLNLIHQSIGLQYNRNTIGLVTGIGLQLQSYRLDKNTTIEERANGKIMPKTLIFEENQKSKFSSAYIIVPLLAEFQVPVKHYANRLYFSAGFYGGLRLSSHTKIKYRGIDNKKEKLKTPDDYSLQKIKCGIMVRTGYRWINIFATYDLTPMFKNNLGPELTPFTIGFSLVSF